MSFPKKKSWNAINWLLTSFALEASFSERYLIFIKIIAECFHLTCFSTQCCWRHFYLIFNAFFLGRRREKKNKWKKYQISKEGQTFYFMLIASIKTLRFRYDLNFDPVNNAIQFGSLIVTCLSSETDGRS